MKRFAIEVKQNGHCWAVDSAATYDEAEDLRQQYHLAEHYESVEIVDSLEVRE